MGVASARPSRSRQRATDSDARRRCSLIGMARSRTVSGNPPIPASAFAANVEKSRYGIVAPRLRGFECLGDLFGNRQGFVYRDWPIGDPVGEGRALHQLEH